MTFSVLGAGFGRTGTLSLKLALEQLGYGPCYHMVEVFENPAHIHDWQAALDGQPVDWDALLHGYRSGVDWPPCFFWRELMQHYPTARVILTVRDARRWYRSAQRTIFHVMQRPLGTDHPVAVAHHEMARQMILERTFGGRVDDEDSAIDIYERHNETVRQTVPPERLLVYDVAQGWEPLCAFLDVAIPGETFPQVNSTEEFRDKFKLD